MKTKQSIVILGITLILLLCLSIPVAESFALSTGSEMGFLSKVTSAFTNPPKGSVLHDIFAALRSSDTELAKAWPKANMAGDSILLSGITAGGSIGGFSDNNPTTLNSLVFSGETPAEMRDTGISEGSSLGTTQNGMFLANDLNPASDPTSLNTRRSNDFSGGGSLTGSGMTFGHSPGSPGSAPAIQTELERAIQPGNADEATPQPSSMVDASFTEGSSSTALPSRADRLAAGTQSSYYAGLRDTEPLYDTGPDTTPINTGLSNLPYGASQFTGNPEESTLPDFIRDSVTMNSPNADTHHGLIAPLQGLRDGFDTAGQLLLIPDAPIIGMSLAAEPIPEPTTFVLIVSGLAGLYFLARKRRAG